MRILIVDDEAPARARLRRLLAAGAEHEIVGEAASGPAAVEAIRALAPDLVLLDIQMPGLDGFGVIEAVGSAAMPAVVFVTAYDAHALRAFEASALDYLLKPVSPERLAASLARVGRLVAPREGEAPAADPGAPGAPGDPAAAVDGARVADAAAPLAERLERMLDALGREREPLRHLLVHHGERVLLVPLARVHRLSAERNYVRIHAGAEAYTLRGTLDALERRLDPGSFLRISRGEIVRLEAVKEMHPWSHGDYHVVLHDGTRLVWSRRYRARDAHRLGG